MELFLGDNKGNQIILPHERRSSQNVYTDIEKLMQSTASSLSIRDIMEL